MKTVLVALGPRIEYVFVWTWILTVWLPKLLKLGKINQSLSGRTRARLKFPILFQRIWICVVMPHSCSVLLCRTRRVPVHSFPPDPIVRELWRQFCGRGLKWIPSKSARLGLLRNHFSWYNFHEIYKANFLNVPSTPEAAAGPPRTGYCFLAWYHQRT